MSVSKTDQLRSITCESDEIICREIVHQIQTNDPRGPDRLYGHFEKAIRSVLSRQVGYNEVDDRLHDIIVAAILAIRRGQVREAARLHAYIRTITRRFVIATLKARLERRRFEVNGECLDNIESHSLNMPERDCIREQQARMAREALNGLCPRYRDVLERIYMLEQDPEVVQRDMKLTPDQYRLIKSRATERFVGIAREKMGLPRLQPKASAGKSDTASGPLVARLTICYRT